MPAPLPNLPVLPHVAAFRAVVALLKASPYTRAVKTWRAWEGNPDDAEDPTEAQAPWVRLSAGGDGGDWLTENQQTIPLVIHVEVFTAGLNSDDPMNLWGALAMALFPGDGTVAGALGTIAGVVPAIRLSAPPFPAPYAPGGGPPAGMLAQGAIRVPVYLSTPL